MSPFQSEVEGICSFHWAQYLISMERTISFLYIRTQLIDCSNCFLSLVVHIFIPSTENSQRHWLHNNEYFVSTYLVSQWSARSCVSYLLVSYDYLFHHDHLPYLSQFSLLSWLLTIRTFMYQIRLWKRVIESFLFQVRAV